VHKHKRCIVSQRELGFDTLSFADALKNALRQAPDVILIGEVRDQETMMAAITLPRPDTCVWRPSTPTTPTRRSNA